MPSENKDPAPPVLSEGASIALGNVFTRLINQGTQETSSSKATGKRPRPPKNPVVLAESEEVRKNLDAEREERLKSREAKRARQLFETNALVIPDAATGATLEKELLVTATKGAVALFNAVSKAQRESQAKRTRSVNAGKRETVTKESFLSMIRSGVGKKVHGDERVKDELNEKEKQGEGAAWLRKDFLMGKSKALKDWDKEAASENSSSEESEQGGIGGTDSSEDDEANSDD